MRRYRFVLTGMLMLPLTGCSFGYYLQAAAGHLSLMRDAVPVQGLLDDPALDPGLRSRLELAGSAVAFAHDSLGLPDNGSYSRFVDLNRSAVVWNVFAAPEFSLEPVTWCFPVAGCVSYRGYFDRSRADGFGDRLRADGHDVFVAGVAAYSTLGRFKDPLVSTMLKGSDNDLVGTIFHELAHQRFYLAGDTVFNESFATAVAREGMRRWFDSRGDPRALYRWQQERERRGRTAAIIREARDTLAALYEQNGETLDMRVRKNQVLDAAREALGPESQMLNNAALAAFAAYDTRISAFDALMRHCQGDLDAFYVAVETIARDEPQARDAMLDRLQAAVVVSAPEAALPDCRGG